MKGRKDERAKGRGQQATGRQAKKGERAKGRRDEREESNKPRNFLNQDSQHYLHCIVETRCFASSVAGNKERQASPEIV
ncbi:MAG: hypothetical protein LBL13_13890 [Bacteroidales bacterium]|nr:hypothetical protein [Bacteroidales bacterium]